MVVILQLLVKPGQKSVTSYNDINLLCKMPNSVAPKLE